MSSLKIICPNGHLGFAPLKVDSFRRGVAAGPDFIAADSGSNDIGPVPLGSDSCASPQAWQEHDLEVMLTAARERGVPMLIGSAADTGSNRGVDLFVGMIRALAAKHRLAPFKLGWFYSEIGKDRVRGHMRDGGTVEGLDGRDALDEARLDATDRIVAVAGVHPYRALLQRGCDVIIGGRSSDSALFAAAALHNGFPEAQSYYLGKVLECASFCAEPYGAKETVLGEVTHDWVDVTAMHPEQRCTVASVAGHAMYERANPFYETVAGGVLDMTDCRYSQMSERTTRVTGMRFSPANEIRVKLEGSGKLGERFVGMAGIRDPYTIAHVDQVVEWARAQTRERFGETGWELHYNVFGRDGVMGAMEPRKHAPAHELLIVVQGLAPTKEMAEEVTMTGTRQLFYARLPDVKGTAGGVSFVFDEVMPASAGYEWTLNHTMRVSDPLELFPLHVETVAA